MPATSTGLLRYMSFPIADQRPQLVGLYAEKHDAQLMNNATIS